MKPTGICYLVGAGPGDPELITVKGRNCLRKAQVLYYDHLASRELLHEAPENASTVYVGKKAACHAMPQERICALICRDVREGKVVVRLKGGDPFIFGRGGEEALALSRAGLPYEVIPGVTAGASAPAYAGIPVTHRGVSTAVTFVTGHEAPGKAAPQTDWDALGGLDHTLCIYMGVRNLPSICEGLIRGGRPATEPVAIIEWGTHDHQRCVTGTLSTIAKVAEWERVKPPSMVVVGEVVALRERLQWFEPGSRQASTRKGVHESLPFQAVVGGRSGSA